MNISLKVCVAVGVLALAMVMLGCQQEGPAQKAGKKLDQAVDKAEKTMDQAVDKAEKKIEAAGETMSDKAEKAGGYMDDSAITAKVKAGIIGDQSLKVTEINVTTKDGVVTLSGTVDSQQILDRALEISRNVKNVKSVVNSLVVQGAK